MEDIMVALSRRLTWSGAAVLTVSCTVALVAQGRTDVTDPGSLAALTAEIRQLRLAVEESTRTQTQTQALGVYLSVQQARLVQVAARLDAARKDLDAASVKSRQMSAALAGTEDALPRVTNPEVRTQLDQEGRAIKQQLESLVLQEQLARSRETELLQMLQVEDARWTDLISRLEQLLKK
jgi:hypothetical protein